MPVHANDITELKRLATNFYDEDKKFVYRVINEISSMEREILLLKSENKKLKGEE